MRKAEERLQLHRVFGERAATAVESERPDFLLTLPDGVVLGVEVTELYGSESDAKLKRLPNYVEALIARKESLHRRDEGALRVEDVQILNADGSLVDTVVAIVQRLQTPAERVNLLFERIREKERKFEEYASKCEQIDLVITDQSQLFYRESAEAFYTSFQPLFPRRRLAESPFREIHLVTTTIFQDWVRIPLISNAFAADCIAYERMLQPEIDAGRSNDELAQLLAACLWHDGYSRVKVCRDTSSVGFHCGAWEVFYGEDIKSLRDWTTPSACYQGVRLQKFVTQGPKELLCAAKKLTELRDSMFAAVDMRLRAYSTDSN